MKFFPRSVKNHLGESLGTVRNIVIDSHEECIAYAVISSKGFLGLGARLIPVPWRALRWDSGERSLILRLEKEELKNAPSIDEPARAKEELLDRDWSRLVHAFY